MREARAALRAAARERGPERAGFDRDPLAVALARENAKRARSKARFEVRAIERLERPREPSLVIANPPYGQRLDASWRALRRALEPALAGHRVALLVPKEVPRDLFARPPTLAERVFNGRIECRFAAWTPRGSSAR